MLSLSSFLSSPLLAVHARGRQLCCVLAEDFWESALAWKGVRARCCRGHSGPRIQQFFMRDGDDKWADCKRGQQKGITSKSVKSRQKVSRHCSTISRGAETSNIVNKCQKQCGSFFGKLHAASLFPNLWGTLKTKKHKQLLLKRPGNAWGVEFVYVLPFPGRKGKYINLCLNAAPCKLMESG